jgi:hypothetical protein
LGDANGIDMFRDGGGVSLGAAWVWETNSRARRSRSRRREHDAGNEADRDGEASGCPTIQTQPS